MLPVTLNPRLGAVAQHDPFGGPALSAFVPVSASQSEVWLAAMMGEEANLSFNEGLKLRLFGALNIAALHTALQTIVNRHEALRGVISPDGRSMGILAEFTLALPLRDISAEPDISAAMSAIEQSEMAQPFNLETGPLLRTTLVKTASDCHYLLLVAHHVVCDGWSSAVVMTELGALYSAAVKGESIELYQPARYGDYSLIEQAFLRSDTGRANEAYWLQKLENPPPPVDLPTDRPRPVPRAYTADRIDHPFPAELVGQLKRTAASQGSSLVTIMLATFAALLNRLTGSEDLIIGLDSAGQALHNQLKLVGHCVNKMPLRLKPARDMRFSDFLKQVRGEVLDAQDHQGVTYGSLIPKLRLDRDESRPVLIAVTFNIDVRDDDISHTGLEVSYDTMVRQADNQELFINVVDNGESLLLEASYNTALFDADSIRRRIAEYQAMLTAVSMDVHQSIAGLPLLTSEERQKLLQLGQGENLAFEGTEQTIHQAIESQAARSPDAMAVVSETEQLSYGELNHRANQLAGWLRANGVAPGHTVALLMERKPSAIVAMLAALKAGAAYLPIDPEYPAERMAYMVSDAKPAVLLSNLGAVANQNHASRDALLSNGLTHLDIAVDWQRLADLPGDNMPAQLPADALAYVLYTSGSTGRPKGTLLEHRGPLNQYRHYLRALQIDAESRVLVFTSLAFDLTQRNLWAPLMAGARIVLVEQTHYDPEPILAAAKTQAISHLCCTPSAFYPLIESGNELRLASLRRLALGGEAIQPERLLAWRAKPGFAVEITNCYGPTEASANVAMYQLPHDHAVAAGSIPIGLPIANTSLYVMDSSGELLPVGVSGELHIGGIQLARGYLNQPGLTAERFIQHPLLGRLYRTGDQCHWRADGQLEYLGRIDAQVKLRGHRVELGEIEACINRHPDIAGCAAGIVERAAGDQRLVAWVLNAPGKSMSASELRNFLRADLPQYMIPQQVMEVEALPLTASGKLDRKALPSPFKQHHAEAPKQPPRAGVEERLAGIWSELLGQDTIGRDDRLFDLGGHSLLAVQVAARIQKQFGKKLALRIVMMSPLSQVALAIDDTGNEPGSGRMVAAAASSSSPAMASTRNKDSLAVLLGNVQLAPSREEIERRAARKKKGFLSNLLDPFK